MIVANENQNYIGFTFFSKDAPHGSAPFEFVGLEQHIHQSILVLLTTNRGDRTLDSQFGSDLKSFIFRRKSPELINEICNEVSRAIRQSEPRVNVLSVTAQQTMDSGGKIEITIQYFIRDTGMKDSLVFPLAVLE